MLKIEDLDLACIMEGAHYRIRIRALSFLMLEIVSQMNQCGVWSLFEYLQVEIHTVLYTRQQTTVYGV